MKFLVIDNQGGEVDSLIYFLRQCFPPPDHSISPQPGQTTGKWSEASTLVNTEITNDADQIIFLDLALDTDVAIEARAGLERAMTLYTHRPEATWIAYTGFLEVLDSHEARTMFHAILNKQRWSQKRTEEEKRALLLRVVEEAVKKRGGLVGPPMIEHEDSSGMRSFFAVYSENALEELLAAECPSWTERRVRALSSGYSGSSLLEINGRKDSAKRQIVVKLAPRRKMIEDETRVLRDYVGEGGVFVGKCAQPSPPKELSGQLGFYSIQEAVPGKTLMSLLAETSLTSPSCLKAMNTVIEVAIEQYSRGGFPVDGPDLEKKTKRFAFTEIDLDRARQACEFLLDIAAGLQSRNCWPKNMPDPKEVFTRINGLLANWRTHLETTVPFLWVLQHGDLNPHNVMVGAADQITFIDLARLGHWPVGYDLSRLAIQLRSRLVDQADRLDWFEDKLVRWCDESLWAPGISRDHLTSLCPPAALCDTAMHEFIETKTDGAEKRALTTGTRVGALYDLLRILSYSDLSPFKRLWVAINCVEQADRLGW